MVLRLDGARKVMRWRDCIDLGVGRVCCCGQDWSGLRPRSAWRQPPAHRGPASRSSPAIITPCAAPGPLSWTETLVGLAIGGREGGLGGLASSQRES